MGSTPRPPELRLKLYRPMRVSDAMQGEAVAEKLCITILSAPEGHEHGVGVLQLEKYEQVDLTAHHVVVGGTGFAVDILAGQYCRVTMEGWRCHLEYRVLLDHRGYYLPIPGTQLPTYNVGDQLTIAELRGAVILIRQLMPTDRALDDLENLSIKLHREGIQDAYFEIVAISEGDDDHPLSRMNTQALS